MATKKEMLEAMTKAKLMKLASRKKVTTVKASMKKDEMVDKIAKSTKVKKTDIR